MVAVVPTLTPNVRNGSTAGNPHHMESADGTYVFGVVVRVSDMGLTGFLYNTGDDPLDPASYALTDLSANPTVVAALGLTDPGNGVSGITVEDDHFMVAAGLDDQNRAWLAGNGHADPQRVCFSDVAAGQPDLTTWNTLTYASMPWAASGANAHTYNRFDHLPTGELLWLFDQQESSLVSRGRDILGYYLPLGRSIANIQAGGTAGWRPICDDTGSGTWTGLAGTSRGELIASDNVGDSPAGVGGGADPGPANRAYISDLCVERRPASPSGWRLHVAFVFRTADTFAQSSQSPGYAYTDVIGTGSLDDWRNADGDAVPMPLHWDNRALFAIPGAPPRTGGAYNLTVKADGRPVFAMQNGAGGVGADPNYGDWIRAERIADSWVLTNLGTITQGHPSPPFVLAYGPARTLVAVTTAGTVVRLRDNGGNVGGPSGSIPNGASPAGNTWQIGGPIDQSELLAYGTQVAGYEDRYFAGIDPVAMSRGILSLLIPDGDDPRLWFRGVHGQFT